MTTKKTNKPKTANLRRARARQKEERLRKRLILAMAAAFLLMILLMIRACTAPVDMSQMEYPSYVQQNFIETDGRSRTGRTLEKVNNIVIHYVANPGSSAEANRNYFNSSQSTVSAHFVVGLQGEVIQCVPLNEQSSASNHRNSDTISIEVCHPDSSGRFNDQTYEALIELTAWLCRSLKLDQGDLIRHYDITGKNCPKYYVERPGAWEQFKKDVKGKL